MPYLINIKRLPRLEAYDRINSWLDRCNSISRLDFIPRSKINYALDHVGSFLPTRQYRLQDVNDLFYQRLRTEDVIF